MQRLWSAWLVGDAHRDGAGRGLHSARLEGAGRGDAEAAAGEDARVGEPSKTCLLKICFPDSAWTSIAVLLNPCAGLHRDIHNSAIHRNCVIGLGDYSGGRIWLEDASGDCPAQLIKDNATQELRGTWLDMHDTRASRHLAGHARHSHLLQCSPPLSHGTMPRCGHWLLPPLSSTAVPLCRTSTC